MYIKKEMPAFSFPALPGVTQLTGSVVSVDLPKKLITLRIMSPYDASESYLATVSFDETTIFHIAYQPSVRGTAGISSGQFPTGLRVEAVVRRDPGTLHVNTLFGSMEL